MLCLKKGLRIVVVLKTVLSDVLSVHDCSDKVLVVDVPLAVLVPHQQLLRLLVTQLLPECGQEMSELS